MEYSVKPVIKEDEVLIIDLFGVLFLLDKFTILKHVGLWDVATFYIKHRTSPLDHTFSLLDKMRQDITQEFQDKVAYKGYYLPRSICLWQQGCITSQDAFERVVAYLDTVPDYICYNRTLVTKIGEFLCVAQTIQKALKLNKHLYEQLCTLKNKHRLYVLSNVDLETWNYLIQHHADVFALFDGVITSGQSQLLKPEKEIFNLLLTQFDLKPACCTLIDDQEEDCLTAAQLGLKTILYTKDLVISG